MWQKGRGAGANPANRYLPTRSELEPEYIEPGADTVVLPERSRSIITSNSSPDVPFDRSINPYRGCEHGCIYCFARPTHAYLDLSPGLDFETRLFYKPDAAALLAKELAKPGYRCRPIAFGTNTDPYQPIEKRLQVTRGLLQILLAHRHPLTIVTKGSLLLRDLDLLTELARHNLVTVHVSVTTLDDDLKRSLEPRAAAGTTRLGMVRQLRAAGVPVGVLVAPVIPAINDSELEAILDASAEAGAQCARYLLLRLPLEVAGLFSDWLQRHFPQRANHVLSLIRQCRDGELNQPAFGTRMRGTGVFAELLNQRFWRAARKLGLDGDLPEVDCHQFRPPRAAQPQGELFD